MRIFQKIYMPLCSVTNKFVSKCATILPKCAQKSATAISKFFLTPSTIYIAFLCINIFQMSKFSLKKLSLPVNNFWILFLLHVYGVPSTLKNAPLWNFLRHRCLKCAHMSTIALTIRHTGFLAPTKIVLGKGCLHSESNYY